MAKRLVEKVSHLSNFQFCLGRSKPKICPSSAFVGPPGSAHLHTCHPSDERRAHIAQSPLHRPLLVSFSYSGESPLQSSAALRSAVTLSSLSIRSSCCCVQLTAWSTVCGGGAKTLTVTPYPTWLLSETSWVLPFSLSSLSHCGASVTLAMYRKSCSFIAYCCCYWFLSCISKHFECTYSVLIYIYLMCIYMYMHT